MAKIHITGWTGTAEELMEALQQGMAVEAVQTTDGGFFVDWSVKKVGRPQKIDKDKILSMRAAGQSYAAIGATLGCSKAYIIKVCKQAQPEGCPEPEIAVESTSSSCCKPEDNADRTLAAYADYLTEAWAAEYDAVLASVQEPEEPVDAPKLQNNLKELRKKEGLTQKQLSDRTGIKLKTIQDWERKGAPIDGDVFRYLLARELHCRVEDLPGN